MRSAGEKKEVQHVWKKNSNYILYAIYGVNPFNWEVYCVWNCYEKIYMHVKLFKRYFNWNLLYYRSLSNLHSQKSRSMKSVKIPWYQKPILHNNKYINVQRGAMLAALFSFVSTFQFSWSILYKLHPFIWFITQFLSIFTIASAIFDMYCLSMAAPGSTHYGYYFISYEFVYVGNRHGMFKII